MKNQKLKSIFHFIVYHHKITELRKWQIQINRQVVNRKGKTLMELYVFANFLSWTQKVLLVWIIFKKSHKITWIKFFMIQATRILLPVVDEDDLYLFINFEDKRDVKNNLKNCYSYLTSVWFSYKVWFIYKFISIHTLKI